MLSKKIISFSKTLSNDFVNYIDSTPNLCMYKLGAHCIPDTVIFPSAKTVTLINCSKDGIMNIMKPTIFPSLSKVNYLSANPGDYNIYQRFNDDIKWVFPNKQYSFYDYMVEAGRGKRDSCIIKEYVASKKIIDGKNGFDISFQFELHIPGFGITNGEWWCSQFYEYLVIKQKLLNYRYCTYPGESSQISQMQDDEELSLQREYVQSSIEELNFDEDEHKTAYA